MMHVIGIYKALQILILVSNSPGQEIGNWTCVKQPTFWDLLYMYITVTHMKYQ